MIPETGPLRTPSSPPGPESAPPLIRLEGKAPHPAPSLWPPSGGGVRGPGAAAAPRSESRWEGRCQAGKSVPVRQFLLPNMDSEADAGARGPTCDPEEGSPAGCRPDFLMAGPRPPPLPRSRGTALRTPWPWPAAPLGFVFCSVFCVEEPQSRLPSLPGNPPSLPPPPACRCRGAWRWKQTQTQTEERVWELEPRPLLGRGCPRRRPDPQPGPSPALGAIGSERGRRAPGSSRRRENATPHDSFPAPGETSQTAKSREERRPFPRK